MSSTAITLVRLIIWKIESDDTTVVMSDLLNPIDLGDSFFNYKPKTAAQPLDLKTSLNLTSREARLKKSSTQNKIDSKNNSVSYCR